MTVCSAGAASPVAKKTDVGEAEIPQRSHLCIVSGLLELFRAFLCIRLSSAAFNSFSSPVFMCWFSVFLYLVRSAARLPQDVA